jgi:hypothetical protein
MTSRFAFRTWSAAILVGALGAASCGGRETQQPSPVAVASTPAYRLTDAAYKVEWVSASVPATMDAGKAVPVTITFKNASGETWPGAKDAVPTQPGAYAVRLGYRWLEPGGGENVPYAGERADLSRPLKPGESTTVVMNILPPSAPGSYELQVDLVCELVAWFGTKGAAKLVTPVVVK